MFMFTSTHERKVKELKMDLKYAESLEYRLSREVSEYKNKYRRLLNKWNELVCIINNLGGEKVLQGKPSTSTSQFTDQELKKLIQLCHPDKHKNSTLSIEITQKLNNLRK